MSITRTRISRRTATVLATALLAVFVPAESRAAAAPDPPSRLQRDADALRNDGVTGVSVRLETPHGVRTVRSGVGDLRTGQPVATDGYLRIGSTTKTFVAVVVLQLAGEGRLSLDDTVDAWLPGLVRGHGNDGREVTLRQLLQHTSGLPDYIGDVVPELSAAGYRANRWTTYTSRQRVALAMRHRPSFAPGAGWAYSNTDYVLLGLVIKAVTGQSWEHEVRTRILRPLRLAHTLAPGNRPFLPRPARPELPAVRAGRSPDRHHDRLPALRRRRRRIADQHGRGHRQVLHGAAARQAPGPRPTGRDAAHRRDPRRPRLSPGHARRARPGLDTAVLRRRILGAQRRRIRLPGVACHDRGRPEHRHGLPAQPPGRRKQRHAAAPRRDGPRRPRTVR
ncbi:beta-lactamase [Streptomyces sp. e14]|nr:beta-lactamase [Streptomyces sp. e14]